MANVPLHVGEHQQAAGQIVWPLEILIQSGRDSDFDLKTAHKYFWCWILRLKFNRLLLEWRICPYRLELYPNSAIFANLGPCQRAGSSRPLNSPAKWLDIASTLVVGLSSLKKIRGKINLLVETSNYHKKGGLNCIDIVAQYYIPINFPNLKCLVEANIYSWNSIILNCNTMPVSKFFQVWSADWAVSWLFATHSWWLRHEFCPADGCIHQQLRGVEPRPLDLTN